MAVEKSGKVERIQNQIASCSEAKTNLKQTDDSIDSNDEGDANGDPKTFMDQFVTKTTVNDKKEIDLAVARFFSLQISVFVKSKINIFVSWLVNYGLVTSHQRVPYWAMIYSKKYLLNAVAL